jgi:hypothetical protein
MLAERAMFLHFVFGIGRVLRSPKIASNGHAIYLAPDCEVPATSFCSGSGVAGVVHPDFSSKLSAKWIGTAKLDAVFSVKIAKVIPMTLPEGPNNGPPEPPSPVRAS